MRIGEIERIGERELPSFTTPVQEPAPEPKREKVLEPEEPEKVN